MNDVSTLMWCLESKTIGGKINAYSSILAPRKQTVEFAKSRSLSCCGRCTPGETQSSKRTRENSLIQRGVGRNCFGKTGENKEENRARTAIALSLSLSLSLSLFFFLPYSPCLAMAWFHAKRCFHGAVISFSQRTYNSPPLFLIPRVLSSTLSCHFSPSCACPCLRLLLSPFPLESSP